jgi:hypothetical protein
MPSGTILLQLSGLVLLVVGGWLSYRRWVWPRAGLGTHSKGLALLLIAAFMGGGLGWPVWWLDAPWGFAWDLPPLAGRMLGAAGLTFVVVCFLALEQPTAARLRLVTWLLAIYLAPLVATILLFHLGSFDRSAAITYAFFAIAGGMSASALWYVIRPAPGFAGPARPAGPPGPLVRAWLAGLAAVTGLWGLALFASDSGPAPLIWAWPGDLLTSRLIGVMLLAIGAGAALSRRDSGAARLMLAGTLTYGAGIVVANLWGLLGGAPFQMVYLAMFAIMAIGSAALLVWGEGR